MEGGYVVVMTVTPMLLIVTLINPVTLTLLTEKHIAATFTRELVLWSTMESINQLEQAGLNQTDWGEWKSWSVVRGETCLNARLAFEWHRGQFGLKWCSVFFCFFFSSSSSNFFLHPPVTPSLVCIPLGLILQFIILLPSKIEWDGDETLSERCWVREWRAIVIVA